ncbi:MAG: BON domain-containing protein [Planctomycetota bacterium]|nr:BON domain-containing protein [Planctomycetota bacterium]MDA0919416.1 BON domain-containing protein [Planctomycetota bacterium]
MAERKLRIDAADAVAIPHPRITMPARDDQPVATGSGLETSLDGTSAIGEMPAASGSALEHAVRQKLISSPHLRISSLVVRQIQGGICLEGTLETSNELTDVEQLVRSVASVDRILNRLVLRPPESSAG